MEEGKEINWGLVIFKLDSIAQNQASFSIKLDEINKKLNELEKTQDVVEDIDIWKGNMEEILPLSKIKDIIKWKEDLDAIVSAPQLKSHIETIEELKEFKTRGSMIWIVVQAIVTVGMGTIALYEFFKK